jgi:hypothetical protein
VRPCRLRMDDRRAHMVATVALGALALVVAVLVASGAVAKDRRAIVEASIRTDSGGEGRLLLVRGISRQFYWPSGHEGANEETIRKGHFQARQYMTDNDGDWCLVMLELKDGQVLVLDKTTSFEIALPETTVRSDRVVVVDSPAENRYWVSSAAPLRFENGHCPYARTKGSGFYVMYVRFGQGSCLSSKGDDSVREFKSAPTGIALAKEGG